MGRAYPELQMVTFTMHGVSATPMVLCDDKGNSLVLDTVSNTWTERLARAATIEMGGSALLAFYPMSGAVAKKAVVARHACRCAPGSARRCAAARADHADPVAALVRFAGRQGAVSRPDHGYRTPDRRRLCPWQGHVDRGRQESKRQTLRLDFQNEFLIAERDGKVLATTPDLIAVVEADSGAPVTTDSLKYGQRLVALAWPCNPMWRTPGGIELVGPRYFKYDRDYVPFEQV